MALPNGVTVCSLSFGPYTDAEGDVQYEGMVGFITPSSPVRHIATGAVIVSQPVKVVIGQGGVGSVVLPQTDQAGIAPSPFTYTLAWQAGRFDSTPGNLTFALPVAAGPTVDFDTLIPTPAGVSVPTGVVSVNGKSGVVSLTAADVGAAPAGSTGSVASVNAKTGTVVLSASDVGADAAGAATAAVAAEVTRADGKYLATAQQDSTTATLVDTPASSTAAALKAAYVPFWTAGETVTPGAVRVDSTGHLITRNANGTTRPSYDSTEQALWTVVSGGGSSGGAVSSVAGRTGAVVLSTADVSGLGSAASQPASAFDAAGAAALRAPLLTPTATKTSAYTAAMGDLAVMNVPAGGAALTLPTAPADKAQVGYRAIGATAAVPLVVTAGGSDTIGTAGAATASIPLADEVTVLQYQAASTRWLAISNVKPQTALDARFDTRRDVPLSITAPNAQAPMSLPTADSSGQLTHASIVKVAGGGKWNGFRYWMVATPYTNATDQMENPNLYCANDPKQVGGVDGWQIPAGLTNPIEPTPADGAAFNSYNSDPDIEFGPDGKLYLFWRLYDVNNVGSEERIYVRSSADGITWAAKTQIITNASATTRPCAPSVVYDGTTWHLWAVDIVPNPNRVVRYSAASPTGPWTLDGSATFTNYPTGRDPWHIDVNRLPSGTYHMLINDVVRDANGGGGRLYLAESTDGGMTWTVANNDLIASTTGRWDGLLYRSSMVYASRGDTPGYEIIYAGVNNALTSYSAWRVGYTSTFADAHATQVAPVHGMAAPELLNLMAARIPLPPFTFGDAFRRANGAIGTADSGQTWTILAGAPTITGNQVAAGTDVTTTATITGTADCYAEMSVAAMAGYVDTTHVQAWLIVRATDASNYLRIGLNAGGRALTIDQVQAGTVTSLVGGKSYGSFYPGIRIGVRCSGSRVTVVLDGSDVVTVNAPFNQTATGIGFQTDKAATVLNWVYSRALVAGDATTQTALPPLVSDTFTRADNATSLGTSDTGQAWTAGQGTWGISSNTAYNPTAVDADRAIIESGTATHRVTVTLTGGAGGGANLSWGVMARCTDASNGYVFVVSNLTGTAKLFKIVAGTMTQLGTTFTLPSAIANGDTISLSASGSTIAGYVRGGAVITVTDATFATGTKVGLRNGSATGSASAIRYDNFTVN